MKVFSPHKILEYMLRNKHKLSLIKVKYRDYFIVVIGVCLFIIFMKGFLFANSYGPKGWDWEWFSSYWEFVKNRFTERHLPLFHFYEISMKTGRPYFFADGETPSLSLFCVLLYWLSVKQVINIYFIIMSIIGILGFVYLGKYLRWHFSSTLFGFCLMFLSGAFLVHLYFGHINWLTLFYFPLIFYNYLNKQRLSNSIAVVMLLALTIFDGGMHVFIWYIIFLFLHSLICSIIEGNIKSIKITLTIFLFVLGLSSIKLIPMYYWHKQHIETTYVLRGYQNFRSLWQNLFDGRYAETLNGGNIWYRHEADDKWPLMVWEVYAYISWAPLVLTLCGIFSSLRSKILFKQYIPILIVGLFFLCMSYGAVWRHVTSCYIFSPLRVERHPSRFIIMFIVSLALFLPFSVDSIIGCLTKGRWNKMWGVILRTIFFLAIIVPLYINTKSIREYDKEGNVVYEESHKEFLAIENGNPFVECEVKQLEYKRDGNKLLLSINSDEPVFIRFKDFDILKYKKYVRIYPLDKVKEITQSVLTVDSGIYNLSIEFWDNKIIYGLLMSFATIVIGAMCIVFCHVPQHRLRYLRFYARKD